LSFHEKHALEQLPERIAALRTTIDDLHRRLDDPTLYARDRQAFDQASSALTAAQGELHIAEEKWLALEILREEAEGR
jgi:ABC transport system ATP-binding/permease protein